MPDIILTAVAPRGKKLHLELLGEDDYAGGVGGWETIARPRRDAAAGWVGTPEVTLVLPVSLDGLRAGKGTAAGADVVVEPGCALLRSWGRKSKSGEPTVLTITGPTLATPGSRWVITDIAWSARIRNNAGRRIRQDLTLTLLQYLEGQVVKSPAKKARDSRNT